MSLPSVETARSWPAKAMVTREGNPLGRITYIYLDRVTGQPTWALVVMGGLRRKRAFVPLTQAVQEKDHIRVAVAGAAVRKAPGLRRRGELPQKHEARLLEHYGEPAGPASSRLGARRASRDAEDAGTRVRRRQGLERATTATTGSGKSRVLRRLLVVGLSLAGSLAASRLLVTRRQTPTGLDAWKAALSWRTADNLKLAAGFSLGYALGAQAGRERYKQIAERARRFRQRPALQDLTAERREPTSTSVERTAPESPASR
jgi:hypothetical protein